MINAKIVTRDDAEMVAIAADWLSRDPLHVSLGITIDNVFEPGTEVVMLYDDNGPRWLVRLHKALRVAVQFNPDTPLANARIGHEVAEWLQELARQGGMTEVIARPGGKADNFTERLGFQPFVGRVLPA